MRSSLFLAGLLLLAVPMLTAQNARSEGPSTGHGVTMPRSGISTCSGLFPAFLRDHPGASVTRQPVGVLAGKGTTRASFAVVVAKDTTDATKRALAIEIRMSDDVRHSVIYLDPDTESDLRPKLQDSTMEKFLFLLTIQHKDRESEFNGMARLDSFVAAEFRNRHGCDENLPTLQAGWRRDERGELGVFLFDWREWSESGESSPRPYYFFPGADVRDLVQILERSLGLLRTAVR